MSATDGASRSVSIGNIERRIAEQARYRARLRIELERADHEPGDVQLLLGAVDRAVRVGRALAFELERVAC